MFDSYKLHLCLSTHTHTRKRTRARAHTYSHLHIIAPHYNVHRYNEVWAILASMEFLVRQPCWLSSQHTWWQKRYLIVAPPLWRSIISWTPGYRVI